MTSSASQERFSFKEVPESLKHPNVENAIQRINALSIGMSAEDAYETLRPFTGGAFNKDRSLYLPYAVMDEPMVIVDGLSFFWAGVDPNAPYDPGELLGQPVVLSELPAEITIRQISPKNETKMKANKHLRPLVNENR